MYNNELNVDDQLPTGWAWTSIDEITEVIRGASPRPKGDPRYFGGNIPWIMISDVTRQPGKFISETRDTVTEAGAEKSRYLPEGTLILSNSGTVCVPKILAVNGCIHDGFVAFPNLTSSINKLFLYYFFEFIRPQVIQDNRQGMTQVNLNTTIVRALELPLAPIEEQGRIVSAIESLFTRLDAGIAALKDVQTKLTRYKASVLKAACEGSLVPQDPDDEPASELLARILEERRAKWEADQLASYAEKGRTPPKNWRDRYTEPQPPDTSDLPELPEGWVWASLEQCSWDSGYGTSDKCDYEGSGPPVLRIPNVSGGEIDLADLKFSVRAVDWDDSRALEPNDLLIIRTNGSKSLIGRSALVREFFDELYFYASYLIRFRLVDVKDVPEWIATIWDSQIVRDWIDRIASTSAGQYNVNTTNLNRSPIPLPPTNYQTNVMDEMGKIVSVIDQVQTTIDTALLRAERLRQSILKDAFAGRLVPQDPDDEPASVLLARIRAERQKK